MPAANAFGAVTLTHPDRVVFPADGITKLDVAEYYRQVMPWLLAGIGGRPLSVIRCPAGISGECFFQKHLKPGLKHVGSVSLKEESGSTGVYVYVDDANGAFELVQFNALEFHPWGATAADPARAQYLVFDLDPAPEIAWSRVVAAAIDVRDLLAKAGLADTTDGTQLTTDQLLRIADEANIWPTIINQNGVPLALGRTQRLASKGQTMALIARDAGCSFPGCTHPPQWCDRHHILDWILGGPTDLDNLTLLCRYHHTHFLQKGWACRINTDGLPEWIPPRWIDQDQQPHINTRIRRIKAQRNLHSRNQRRTPAAA